MPLLLAQAGLETADYAVLVIYLLAVIALGAWFSRGEGDTEAYLLGGRNIPWWAIGISTPYRSARARTPRVDLTPSATMFMSSTISSAATTSTNTRVSTPGMRWMGTSCSPNVLSDSSSRILRRSTGSPAGWWRRAHPRRWPGCGNRTRASTYASC